MRTRSLALPIALTMLALVVPGCSVTVDGGGQPADSEESSASQSGTGAEGGQGTDGGAGTDGADPAADPAGVLPDGATWLFDVPSESSRGSGQRTEARIAGGTDDAAHPNSTDQWLGCDGVPDVTVYDLGGAYTEFSGWLAMREGTPDGVLAVVDVTTDQGVIGRYQVDDDGGTPLEIVLDGARTLTFSAELSAGECTSADESYLVLVDAYVR